jgi:hypothetical protein
VLEVGDASPEDHLAALQLLHAAAAYNESCREAGRVIDSFAVPQSWLDTAADTALLPRHAAARLSAPALAHAVFVLQELTRYSSCVVSERALQSLDAALVSAWPGVLASAAMCTRAGGHVAPAAAGSPPDFLRPGVMQPLQRAVCPPFLLQHLTAVWCAEPPDDGDLPLLFSHPDGPNNMNSRVAAPVTFSGLLSGPVAAALFSSMEQFDTSQQSAVVLRNTSRGTSPPPSHFMALRQGPPLALSPAAQIGSAVLVLRARGQLGAGTLPSPRLARTAIAAVLRPVDDILHATAHLAMLPPQQAAQLHEDVADAADGFCAASMAATLIAASELHQAIDALQYLLEQQLEVVKEASWSRGRPVDDTDDDVEKDDAESMYSVAGEQRRVVVGKLAVPSSATGRSGAGRRSRAPSATPSSRATMGLLPDSEALCTRLFMCVARLPDGAWRDTRMLTATYPRLMQVRLGSCM